MTFSPSSQSASAVGRSPLAQRFPTWCYGLFAGLCLYTFLCAINIMGAGLKTLATGETTAPYVERFFAHADNPFIALMAAVVVTALVQSSSFTTSMIVALAATGALKVEAAVFAVMGANIGTAVTGVIVALANMRFRRQFRRAFTAALMHDMFNLLTVGILFPLEWISAVMHPENRGLIGRAAHAIANNMGLETSGTGTNPIKFITNPVVKSVDGGFGRLFTSEAWHGSIVAIVGLSLLAVSLVYLVKSLKGAILRRMEGLFRSFFFRNDLSSYVVGSITTVMVQSSTVTTSLMVPLAGAGVVKMRRIFPFMLGANLGTTITGMIAAAAITNDPGTAVNEKVLAVMVSASHVMFNLIGTAIWYPLRFIPVGLAQAYGRLAAKSKRYAFGFLVLVFIVIPVIGIVVTELLVSFD